MKPWILVLVTACTVRPHAQTIGRAGGTIDNGAVSIHFDEGALSGPTQVGFDNLGSPQSVQPDGLGAHSMLWAIEPVSLVLNRPATVSIVLPEGTTDSTIYSWTQGVATALPTTVANGVATTRLPVLTTVFAAQSVIVTNPTPPPTAPPPTAPPPTAPPPPPPPPPPPGSYPTAGETWSCGTGLSDRIDLADFDDTAVPTPATVLGCGGGVAAHLNGTAYSSLRGALLDAGEGALVQVCPGVHEGPFYTSSRDLTLEGHAADRAATVLTSQLRRPVLVPSGALTVRRLTIRRGYAPYSGAGIDTRDPLTVEDVSFVQNFACYTGGGVSASGRVRLSRSSFIQNIAGYEAAGVELGIRWDPADVLVEDCLFESNTAAYSAGAISVDGNGGTIRLAGSTFLNNHAGYGGGALVNGSWDAHRLEIDGSHFEGNTAGYQAAALDLASWSPADDVLVRDTRFINNHTPNGGSVNIEHWEGGRFAFESVVFDEPDVCAVRVSIQGGSTAEVSFEQSIVEPDDICVGTNATVTIDGVPVP